MERDAYFDNCKAILIILVVIGHTIDIWDFAPTSVPNYIWYVIYSFHMPAFTFVSGYFAKTANRNKAILKYSAIYVMASLMYLPFHLSDGVFYSVVVPFWILWYLCCLVYWQVLISFIRHIPTRLAIPLSLVAGIGIGYFYTGGIFAVQKTIYFLPYFLAGYYIDKHTLDAVKVALRKKLPIVITATLAIILVLSATIPREIFSGKYTYSFFGIDAWYGGIIHLSLYVLSFLALFCFFSLVPVIKKPWTKIGQYTLPIYIIHGLIIGLFEFNILG